MDYKTARTLLDKYWNCETSLEEENQLRLSSIRGNASIQWHRVSESHFIIFLFTFLKRSPNLSLFRDNQPVEY